MSRKALATIGFGPMEAVLDEALPTYAEFCERHSYDLIAWRTNEHANGRPASWGKVRLLRELLDRYDVVLWIDSDAIILDASDDPSELLGPHDYQALACLHFEADLPNCGVWLLRSTPKAKAFLDAVWRKEEFIHDRLWENGAVLDLLGYSIRPFHLLQPTEWFEGTHVLDNSWNSMPFVTRRLAPCRIRHYGGESNAVRRRQMRTDRHALAALRSQGWSARWHTTAAIVGRLRWRLWDGPTGPTAYGRGYRLATHLHRIARSVGLLAVVRTARGGSRSVGREVERLRHR